MIIGILGANGFVGNEIYNNLKNKYKNIIPLTRENYLDFVGLYFDCIINSAMPSKRFWAKNNPKLDYEETVNKTKSFIDKFNFKKFIQISSISARCQVDTIYGRNKKLSEDLCKNLTNYLIIRLGPLYGKKLSKGVIIDMINNSTVYVSGESKYAFTDIKWFGEWLSENIHLEGLIEVGPNNYIKLLDLAKKINSKSKFEGPVDNQVIFTNKIFDNDANNVINYINQLK